MGALGHGIIPGGTRVQKVAIAVWIINFCIVNDKTGKKDAPGRAHVGVQKSSLSFKGACTALVETVAITRSVGFGLGDARI